MTAPDPNPPRGPPSTGDYDWGARSDVVWTETESSSHSGRRTFGTLFEAVEFIMYRLHPSEATVVVVHPENGEPLVGLTQIREAWDQVR